MAHLKYPKNHFCKAEFCKYLEVSPSSEPDEKRRRLSSPKTPPVFSPIAAEYAEAAVSPLKAVNLDQSEVFIEADNADDDDGDDNFFVVDEEEIPPIQYENPPHVPPEPAEDATQDANNQPISESNQLLFWTECLM